MKDDIENMSREWKRSTNKRVQPRTVRREMTRNKKRNTLAKAKCSTRGSLDSFISQSIRNLGDEEMDEEKSFYSLQQRSTASEASDKDAGKKQPIDNGNSTQAEKAETASTSKSPGSTNSSPAGSQDETNRVFGQDVDAVEATDQDSSLSLDDDPKSIASAPASSPGGGRRSLMAKGFSLRDSFRNLGQEIDDESVSSKAFDKRLENLRAKSLRGDLLQEKGRKKSPPKSTLRSSRSVGDRKAVLWEDPSRKDDEAKLKASQQVAAWAAVDLAPITTLSV